MHKYCILMLHSCDWYQIISWTFQQRRRKGQSLWEYFCFWWSWKAPKNGPFQGISKKSCRTAPTSFTMCHCMTFYKRENFLCESFVNDVILDMIYLIILASRHLFCGSKICVSGLRILYRISFSNFHNFILLIHKNDT